MIGRDDDGGLVEATGLTGTQAADTTEVLPPRLTPETPSRPDPETTPRPRFRSGINALQQASWISRLDELTVATTPDGKSRALVRQMSAGRFSGALCSGGEVTVCPHW